MSGKDEITIIVCGGRNYADEETVFAALDHLHKKRNIGVMIHGAAPGADMLAAKWSLSRGVFSMGCMANWKRHGKAAGPIRNTIMLNWKPDGVVAFPGGSGTADMKRQAIAAGVNVWEPVKC